MLSPNTLSPFFHACAGHLLPVAYCVKHATCLVISDDQDTLMESPLITHGSTGPTHQILADGHKSAPPPTTTTHIIPQLCLASTWTNKRYSAHLFS